MSLRPFVLAWCVLVVFAFAGRGLLGIGTGAGFALGYALASGLIVAATVHAYRRRLRAFLRTEHAAVWAALGAGRGGRVTERRLLHWLLTPEVPADPERRAARRTGARVAVIAVTWLMSTPAVCLLLALWRT